MSGAFDAEFADEAPLRVPGQANPGVVAACADHPAEAALIGAMLRDKRLIDKADDKLRAEDFSNFLFSQVFSAAVTMHREDKLVSPITVAERLKGDQDLSERGGAKYLAQLAMSDRADRGDGYLDHLVDLARRRLFQAGINEARGSISNTAVPLDQTVAEIEGVLATALTWTDGRPAVTFVQAWDQVTAEIRNIAEGRKKQGIQLPGMPEWNDVCGGAMVAGQLILLGARPAMGKTLTGIGVAWRAAEAGYGVLFVSREMTVDQLMMRVVADMMFDAGSHITMADITAGRLTERDFARMEEIRAKIEGWPLVFESPDRLNANNVAPMVRRHHRKMAQRGVTLSLAVIDYLGLLDPPTKRGNKEQEMSDVSREMKRVATSTNITVLALAQLNRALESREDKRPMMSDLRDSGSLEQDADTIVFVHRDEYYLQMSEPAASDAKRRDEWEIAMGIARNRMDIFSSKVRQGAPSKRKIYYYGERQAIRSGDHNRATSGWAQGGAL